MNKITPLETKCLANMPVVLDAIATTIDTLSEILNPQYDRIEECLTEFFDKHKRLKFDFEDGREFQSKYIFTDRFTQYKKKSIARADHSVGIVLLHHYREKRTKRRIVFCAVRLYRR